MTAPALSLVPLDARPEPAEALVLRPVVIFVPLLVPEPLKVSAARRRPPVRAGDFYGPMSPMERSLAWRKPRRKAGIQAPERYECTLDTYRAPARRARDRRPIRTKSLYTYVEFVPQAEGEIRLPRSRKRPVASPRALLGGDSHETLTNQRMTPEERAEHARDIELLKEAGVSLGMSHDDRDCPTGPCPHIQCRHHLYIEANGKRLTLNFPGQHIDEIPETCSLRVARAAAVRRQESNQPNVPAMSCAEVGRFLNLTPEAIRTDEKRALAKLRAAGIELK